MTSLESPARLDEPGGKDDSLSVTFRVVAGAESGAFDLAFEVQLAGGVYYFSISTVEFISVGAILDEVSSAIGFDGKPDLSSPWSKVYDIELKPRLQTGMGGSTSLEGRLEFKAPFVIEFFGVKLLSISALTASFVDGGLDFGADIELLGRELILEYPFPAPLPPPSGFQLNYFGMGQRLAVQEVGSPPSMETTVETMKKDLGELKGDDLDKVIRYYDPSAGWLFAADIGVVGTFRLRVIFNDPVMYGLGIEIDAAWAKGFRFEILYKKISDEIGMYFLDLTLPDLLRQLEFGAVSVTLPSIAITIYTNSDFKISVGWPLGERSIAVQVLPFLGTAGFYFAKLSGETAEDIPNPGAYGLVLEFGIGMSIGVGKEVRKGILVAALSLSAYGIFEGRVAWKKDAATLARELGAGSRALTDGTGPGTDLVLGAGLAAAGISKSPDYIRFRATLGIIGLIEGCIDFAIIKATLSIRAEASATVIFETAKDTVVILAANVKVKLEIEIASFKIFGVRIRIYISLSFSADLTQTFVIGNSAEVLAWRSRMHLAEPVRWLAPAAATERVTLPLYFAPQITAVKSSNPSKAGAQFVATLSMPSEPAGEEQASPFELFARALGEWALTAGLDDEARTRLTGGPLAWNADPRRIYEDLRVLDARLSKPRYLNARRMNDQPLTYEALIEFLKARFVFEVSAMPVPATEQEDQTLACATFPVFAEMTLKVTGRPDVDFRSHNRRDENYRERLRAYFEELQLAFRPTDTLAGAIEEESGPSMAMLAFEDYCAFVIKETVDQLADHAARAAFGPRPPGALALSLQDVDYGALAAKVSRFSQGGVRVPDHIGDDRASWPTLPLFGLYDMTGQQFRVELPIDADYGVTLALDPDDASWLKAGTTPPAMVIPAADAEARTALNALSAYTLDPGFVSVEWAAPLRSLPVEYQLRNATAWTAPGQTLPTSLVALSAVALDRVAASPGQQATLQVLEQVEDGDGDTQDVVRPASAAMRIDLTITRVRRPTHGNVGKDGESHEYEPRLYLLGGTDETSRRRLGALLTSPELAGLQQVDLAYPVKGERAMASTPPGSGCFLFKTNLSTSSNPPVLDALRQRLLAEDEGDPTWAAWGDWQPFLTLVWELSIVNSGGFYLHYVTPEGEGLPEELFEEDDPVEVTLLLRFAESEQVPLHAFQDSLAIPPTSEPGARAAISTEDGPAPLVARLVDQLDWDAAAPAGSAGFEVTRTNPELDPPPDQGELETSVQKLYNLVQYRIEADGGFRQSTWSLPAGPADETSGAEAARALRSVGDDEAGPWVYRQTPTVYRFVAGASESGDPNRYDGVGRTLTLGFQAVDMFGNALLDGSLQAIAARKSLDLRYHDRIASVAEWPGVSTEYHVRKGTDADAASLRWRLRFDPAAVISEVESGFALRAGTREPPTPAQAEEARDAYVAYGRILDQVRDPNTQAELITSLRPDQPEPLPVPEFVSWLQAIRAYLAAVREGQPWPSGESARRACKSWVMRVALPFAALDKASLMFGVDVWIRHWREAFVDEETALKSPVTKEVFASVPPDLGSGDSTHGESDEHDGQDGVDDDDVETARYVWFARKLEQAYEGRLKLALGRGRPRVVPSRARLAREPGVADKDAVGAPGAADVEDVSLWAVRYGHRGLRVVPRPERYYYAPRPISTSLLSGTWEVRKYKSTWDGTDSDFTIEPRKFTDADLDAWAVVCLDGVDGLLSPEFCWAVVKLAPASYQAAMQAKRDLAHAVSGQLDEILATAEPAPEPLRERAREKLRQMLLVSLGEGYGTSAVVQVPVDVHAPEGVVSGTETEALYGEVREHTPQVGTEGGEPRSASSYSVDKIRLDDEAPAVTTLFTSQHPTRERHHPADLVLDVSYAELGLPDASGSAASSYLPSRWLRFILPGGTGKHPDDGLGIDLGGVDIPIPLRRFPESPVMERHGCSPSVAKPTKLQQTVCWDYEVDYFRPAIIQDRVHVRVEFNRPWDAGLAAEPDRLFEALARFSVEAPEIEPHLATVLEVAGQDEPPEPERAVALAAIDRYVSLVTAVAEAWAERAEGAATGAAEGDDPEHVINEYWIEEAEAGEGCGSERVNLDPRGVRLVRSLAARPRLRVRRFFTPEGGTDRPRWPAIGDYRLAEECPPHGLEYQDAFFEPVPAPGAGESEDDGYERRLVFEDQNVLLRQRATTSTWIERNVRLLPEVPTNPAFIYQSPVATFSQPVLPFNDIADEIWIDDLHGSTLFTKLVNMFNDLLDAYCGKPDTGSLATQTLRRVRSWAERWKLIRERGGPTSRLAAEKLLAQGDQLLKLSVSYGYDVSLDSNGKGVGRDAGSPLRAWIPAILSRDEGTQLLVGDGFPDFTLALAKKLVEWHARVEPSVHGGVLSLDLTLFADQSRFKRPILRLQRIMLSVGASPGWWS